MCRDFLVCFLQDNLPNKPIIVTLQVLSPASLEQMSRDFTASLKNGLFKKNLLVQLNCLNMIYLQGDLSECTEAYLVCLLLENLPSKPIIST